MVARARCRGRNCGSWDLGTEQAALQALAERRGLDVEGQAVRPGPLERDPGWLRQCDVGILPIRRDVFLDFAFPNKLPEFIVTGKPCSFPG